MLPAHAKRVARKGRNRRSGRGTPFAIRDMRIDAWMKHPVVTMKVRDTVKHAREVMETHCINQLPVVTDGRLVGIVTDRDLRDAFPSVFDAFAPPRRRRGKVASDPTAIHVEDVMTADVLTLAPSAFMADAARLMRRERVGAIPIVDGGRVVGILTRSDVLDAFAELARSAAG
jgi:acetoin utilization protein AcuB